MSSLCNGVGSADSIHSQLNQDMAELQNLSSSDVQVTTISFLVAETLSIQQRGM